VQCAIIPFGGHADYFSAIGHRLHNTAPPIEAEVEEVAVSGSKAEVVAVAGSKVGALWRLPRAHTNLGGGSMRGVLLGGVGVGCSRASPGGWRQDW
jgi:hypothetical protein